MTEKIKILALALLLAAGLLLGGFAAGWKIRGEKMQPPTADTIRIEKIDTVTLVEPMVERHSKEMGVRPSRIYYKPTISRWGQCNVKDRSICFSAYVLLLPDWCVEHVVVHELCHLLEPSHNARFHALMDQYFPRWREARKETLRISR
jgi:predicted metal-dependent hydrolase